MSSSRTKNRSNRAEAGPWIGCLRADKPNNWRKISSCLKNLQKIEHKASAYYVELDKDILPKREK